MFQKKKHNLTLYQIAISYKLFQRIPMPNCDAAKNLYV